MAGQKEKLDDYEKTKEEKQKKKKKLGIGLFKKKKCKDCQFLSGKLDEINTINEILIGLVEKHAR